MKNFDYQLRSTAALCRGLESVASRYLSVGQSADVNESVVVNSYYIKELAGLTDRYMTEITESLGALISLSDARRGRAVFSTTDGDLCIALRFRFQARYSEGAAIGVAMIRAYIYASRRAELRSIGRLLRRRGAGGVDLSLLSKLDIAAHESEDRGFVEGIERLKSAMSTIRKFTFIEMRRREAGVWHVVYSKKL